MLYRYRTYFRVLFWLALIVSYTAAILPQEVAPTIGTLGDKAHHILAFWVLGVLLRLAYQVNYLYGLLILIGYGNFIEVSQYFTPNRCAEYQDIVADTIGIFIGFIFYRYIQKVI